MRKKHFSFGKKVSLVGLLLFVGMIVFARRIDNVSVVTGVGLGGGLWVVTGGFCWMNEAERRHRKSVYYDGHRMFFDKPISAWGILVFIVLDIEELLLGLSHLKEGEPMGLAAVIAFGMELALLLFLFARRIYDDY